MDITYLTKGTYALKTISNGSGNLSARRGSQKWHRKFKYKNRLGKGLSPSTRGRGLKPSSWAAVAPACCVALHARARIETVVAEAARPASKSSPSTRGRGLKPVCPLSLKTYTVALHARARIETIDGLTVLARCASPSTRGRGLKLLDSASTWITISSPSTRGRGLKPGKHNWKINKYCRPPREGAD